MGSAVLSPPIGQLCRILDQETAACRSLLDTVHEERGAIRSLAITEFHGINCRRLAILETLQSLADQRQRLVQEWAGRQGWPHTTSVHHVLDRLTDAPAELRNGYQRYMSVARLVRDEIKQNVVLIEGIREVVSQALSAGTTVVPGQELYTPAGQSANTAPVNVLLHQQG
jgi:hypothetical protein